MHTRTHTINVNKTCSLQQKPGKTGTKHSLCEIVLHFVLIDDYAFAYLFLMIQNGYAYRFGDISICQKYHTELAL
jgi:hypothetical protein